MTTSSPALIDFEARLGAALTEQDVARISAAITATRAPATRTVYASAWRRWERWCARRGIDSRGERALGADPVAVCTYLAERAADGVSAASVDLACSAIGYHHRRDGLCDPTAAEVVGQVRRGLHRILGTAPRRPARSRSDPRRSNDSCRAAATQPDRMRKRRAARVGLGDTP
jgi:hypothetical protein